MPITESCPNAVGAGKISICLPFKRSAAGVRYLVTNR
jgi:hypothetical protein